MITVTVTPESQRALKVKLDNAKKGVQTGLRSGINAAIISLESSIKKDYLSGQLANAITGNLRRSVFSRMVDDRNGLVGVGAEAPYAIFVNDGTRPHIIEARNAKALRFEMGGNVLYRRMVNHPGTKPTLFMETALKDNTPSILRIIQERVNRGVKGQGVE